MTKRRLPFQRTSVDEEKSNIYDEKDSGISSGDAQDSDILDLLLDDDNNDTSKVEAKDFIDLSVSELEKQNSIQNHNHFSEKEETPVKKKRGPKNKLLYRMGYNKEGEYVKIYQCHQCEKEYKYQSGVSNHLRQAHKSKQ